MGRARDRASADLNGQEFILDADADTSISADTDDQIDIKIAGADDFQFTANTFTAQSGSTIAAQALTATTITTSSTVDVQGNEIILDDDGDTSITADTDDEIHVKIGGADDFKFKANTLEVQTGSNIDMNGTELILDADADTSIHADTDDQIDFKTGGTDRMRIDSSGRVGIGLNPADYTEHSDDLVLGGSSGNKGITIVGGDSGYSNISLNRSSNTSTTPNGAIEYNHTDNQMYIKTNGSAFLQGNSDGSVLKPKQPCFSKGHTGGSPTTIDTTGHVIVSMGGTEHFDLGNNVDSIGKFTAPVAGRYLFIMTHYVYAINASDDSHMYTYFYVNGSAASLGINQAPLQWYRDGHTANAEKQVQHLGFASLSANDYVQMGFWTSHANIFKHLGSYLSLSGFLVG